MSAVAWGLAAAGAAVAAVSAVADGALLSDPPGSATALPERTPVAPVPAVSRSIPSREQSHRALAFARVIGHLIAGAGLALALDLANEGRWDRVLA